MKIYKLILAGLILIAGTIVSCEEYEDTVEPSPIISSDNPAVRFSKENQSTFELDPNNNPVITLAIIRSGNNSTLEVPVNVITNTDDSFNVPSNVSFSAGEDTTMLSISLNPNAPTGIPLSLEISFEEQYVNPYKSDYAYYSGSISLLNWLKYSNGTYTSEFFEQSWDQELYRAEGTDKYRFYDLYVAGYHYDFEWSGGNTIIPSGSLNAEGYAVQESGYIHATHGMVSTATDSDPGYTNYNAETKVFTFDRMWHVPAGSFGWHTATYEITEVF